jgi:hypothetical protein
MATHAGAQILGLSTEIGSIDTGFSASRISAETIIARSIEGCPLVLGLTLPEAAPARASCIPFRERDAVRYLSGPIAKQGG